MASGDSMKTEADRLIAEILSSATTIAILGASPEPERAGNYVGAYLARVGYDVVGVNPHLVGQTLWGRPVVGSLAEVGRPIDLVDVFRRGEHLPAHAEEILALVPRPACVWFQLGVNHPGVATTLRAAGITVIENRCTYAEHRRLGLGAR